MSEYRTFRRKKHQFSSFIVDPVITYILVWLCELVSVRLIEAQANGFLCYKCKHIFGFYYKPPIEEIRRNTQKYAETPKQIPLSIRRNIPAKTPQANTPYQGDFKKECVSPKFYRTQVKLSNFFVHRARHI